MKKLVSLFLILLPIVLLNPDLYAGGPLNSFNGRSIVYQSSDFPVPYHPDQGGLGSFSNSQATTLVDTCFQVWQNVSTATINFQNGGQLPVDVNSTNYFFYLDNFSDGVNPIIFDSDGSIIDAEYGNGASDNIIGFAGSAYNTFTGYYVEGLAVLNGKFSTVFTYDQFKATFVHEFGHFFGLDHTQINVKYVGDGITANDIYVPTMYPTTTDDDTSLGDLNPDDEAAVTLLYPSPSVNLTYGRIKGTVKWGSSQAVLGANVVAVKIGDEDMSQFSSISDYFMQNNGEYEMYVTPGDYKLFIEPINQAFTGGSSVGPYAENLLQPSFTNPVIKEYYNGVNEIAYEADLNDFVVIAIAAGETVSDINFIVEGGPLLWTSTLYERILGGGGHENLLCLRNFRDEVLLSNDKGKKYVYLLYNHSEEVASLLLQDLTLSSHMAEVIRNLLPGVNVLLNGGEISISQELIGEIESMLEGFEDNASPELKAAIKRVRKGLSEGEIFKQIGIVVE